VNPEQRGLMHSQKVEVWYPDLKKPSGEKIREIGEEA